VPSEIDAIALVEVELGLAGDDRRQMENHKSGRSATSFSGCAREPQNRMSPSRPETLTCRFGGRDDVPAASCGDVAFAEETVAQQPFGQFAADHAGSAQTRICKTQLLLSYSIAAGLRAYSFTAPVIADT